LRLALGKKAASSVGIGSGLGLGDFAVGIMTASRADVMRTPLLAAIGTFDMSRRH
jgi:uncharacterized protein (UPF0254 family)